MLQNRLCERAASGLLGDVVDVPRTRCLGLLGQASWVRKRTAPGDVWVEHASGAPRSQGHVVGYASRVPRPQGSAEQICCYWFIVHRKVGVAALRGGSSLALKGGLGPRILIHFNTCAPLGECPPFGAVWRFGVGPGRSPPQTHHCLSCNACKPPQGVIKLIQLSTTDLLAFASMKNAAKVRNVM
jgi:hypothetical protein